jgi:drug/metabolite transporter (DMT)-like permease
MSKPFPGANAGPVALAVLSALFFGLSTPLAKILLEGLSPAALAGLLYLGAFSGLSLSAGVSRLFGQAGGSPGRGRYAPLGRADIPWLAGSVLCGGIIGPIALMSGVRLISGLSATLLLNLEGLATAVIAVVFFGEHAGRRIWLALALMTAAGVLTVWTPGPEKFTPAGPLLVLAAMVSWGLDNNFTGRISEKNPVLIAGIKGLAAGSISLAVAFATGAGFHPGPGAAFALVVGAFGYGLSLVLFIRALRGLGAFRAGAFFSLAPFIGSLASLLILREPPAPAQGPAAVLMAAGVWLILGEKHGHRHLHASVSHAHTHVHGDLHHGHDHDRPWIEPHAHEHVHASLEHAHDHRPDLHHRHHHP